jgi:hypothetical protein
LPSPATPRLSLAGELLLVTLVATVEPLVTLGGREPVELAALLGSALARELAQRDGEAAMMQAT